MMAALRALSGIVIAAALVAATMLGASVAQFPMSSSRADIDLGRQVFQSNCASCHSIDSNQGPTYGPSLQHIGKTAVNHVNGMSAEEYVFQSIVNPSAYRRSGSVGEMSDQIAVRLSRNELFSVTAYLCAQGSKPNYKALVKLVDNWSPPAQTPSQSLTLASLERGRTLFFDTLKCNVCHSVDGSPGASLLAPDLSRAGLHTRQYLRESIANPDAHIVSGYEQWSVLHVDGIAFTGRRLPSGSGSVRLIWIDEGNRLQTRSFRESDLEEIDKGVTAKKQNKSAMPSFRNRLSSEDRESLLDFLSTLR